MPARLSCLPFAIVVSFVVTLCGAMPAFAGTTGQLTGVIINATTHAPVAGARVTAASASQVATTTTGGNGAYTFLSLVPDTYVVSVERDGFESSVVGGVVVTADDLRTISASLAPKLVTIGHTSTRNASNLVQPGTTSDVYSIDATTQQKLALAGGGGTQNSAFSALATVPGVYVMPGQSGYIGAGGGLSIRGGDYDQIGYEIDGVPVNRSFDSYPSGPTSSLGQQELQVYTGGGPATSEAQGLSGYINQVIRVGTQPGFTTLTSGIGGPVFYHKLAFETGGATTDRNFSYYVGIGGYDETNRVVDHFNGRGVGQLYGVAIAPCADAGVSVVPSCYVKGALAGTGVSDYNYYLGEPVNAYALGGANLFAPADTIDRDNVINLHLAIPRKNGLRDDIQALGMVNFIRTSYYDSTNDLGGAGFLSAIGYSGPAGVPYTDGLQLNSPTGVFLPANYQSLTSPYLFPYSPRNRQPDAAIAPEFEDTDNNNQGIFKLQLTHPLGQNALLKLYGYTYYSNWLQNGPQTAYANFYGADAPDYTLSTNTRGVNAALIDQLDAKNLLSLQGALTASTIDRDNSTEYYDTLGGSREIAGYVVDSSDPTNGLCYSPVGGAPVSCFDRPYNGTSRLSGPGVATLAEAAEGSIIPATGTCGGGPCKYLVTGNGQYGNLNRVRPIFTSGSLTDNFQPTSKLDINGGIRMDIFAFRGAVTQTGTARTFAYNAFNLDHCLDADNDLSNREPGAACPAGERAADFQNPSGVVTESYTRFQPRLGATYTANPTTVFRASYGRYAQAPNAAFEQYDGLQPNVLTQMYLTDSFQKYGFTTPDHAVRPQVSDNFDLSIEHQFPGQLSVKLTPCLRTTHDQIQQFYLNEQTSYVSGLNVGEQTSRGLEFELDKGDFHRDGFAGRLTLSYTNSYITYKPLPNGSNIIDPLNASIAAYNAYTSQCAPGGKLAGKTQYGTPVCGSIASGVAPSACYSPATSMPDGSDAEAGVAEPCSAAGAVANPYWNAPAQGLLDPNGRYTPYGLIPSLVGSSVNGYGEPYVASLLLNYKKGPFSISPLLTLDAGQRYGAPESTYGVNPELCGALAGSTGTAGDPRYPYGSAGGAGFDVVSVASQANGCTSGLVIPNPYSKRFDGIGAFVAPAMAQLQLQMSYDVSKNFTIVAGFTNLYTNCFGGSKEPWNVAGACGYGVVAGGSAGDLGNQYDPGAVIQPYTNTPYLPVFSSTPFNMGVGATLKL